MTEHGTSAPTDDVPVIGPRRRAIAGFTDQAFNAGSNAINGLVAGVLLGPLAYGRYVAAIGVAFIAVAVGRAFIGEVLLSRGVRAEGEEFRGQLRDASATALLLGAASVVLAIGVWLLGFDLLRDLLWLVPFLPAALLSDAGRYAFLSHRRPQRSMLITGVGLLVQLGVVLALVVEKSVNPASLLVAWGVGITVSAVVGLSLMRINPFGGSPRRWVAETRHLSTWFTASAILAQLQNWAVLYFVGGFLGHAELGGLRMLQMLVLMPVQNFIWAMAGLIVPGYSHFSESGDLPRIRRRTRGLTAAFALMAVLLLALVPLGEWLLSMLLPEYEEFGVLVWPIALQAGLYLVQSPLNAALRGMQQARYAFLQYAVFAAALLPAALVGAGYAGVVGAAYGMVVGAAAGAVAAYLLYTRTLHARRPHPA